VAGMNAAATLLFALKLYVACMLAFVASVHLGLEQNYWASVTCVALANPISANVRSKALYRLLGTLGAGVTALAIGGLFGILSFPVVLASGVVATLGFTVAAANRTPRAYALQLFAVTLCLIAVGNVEHPGRLFDIALLRVTEICIGIAAITLVDGLAPTALGPSVRTRLRRWLPEVRQWLDDAVAGNVATDVAAQHRLKAVADLSALSLVAEQLRFDSTVSNRQHRLLFALQRRLARLVPLIGALEATTAGSSRLHDPAWRARIVATRQRDLARAQQAWTDIQVLDDALEKGDPLPPHLERSLATSQPLPLAPDHHHALRIGGGCALAYALICLLWWATGWAQGPNMLIMGTVTLAFFGIFDGANLAAMKFGRFAALSVALSVVLGYLLLPMAQSFSGFALACALVIMPLAVWSIEEPLAILLLALTLSNAGLASHYQPQDFGTFLDMAAGTLIGIFIGFFCLLLVKRMGAEAASKRLQEDGRQDLATLGRTAGRDVEDAFLERDLDRIGQLGARATGANAVAAAHLFRQLRLGHSLVHLQRATHHVAGIERDLLDALMRRLHRELAGAASPGMLGDHLDRVLRRDILLGSPEGDALTDALVHLRLALEPVPAQNGEAA